MQLYENNATPLARHGTYPPVCVIFRITAQSVGCYSVSKFLNSFYTTAIYQTFKRSIY